MEVINGLISQIEDKTLRERIQCEVTKMNNIKKFGLVFEEHLPECIPLYGLPIKKGITVSKKGTSIKNTYIVAKVAEGVATCVNKQTKEVIELNEASIVPVSQFGEPIYPQLIPMDKVENAPDSSLWHTLIEADNYHALQLLEYLYPKQVDCIYIDPPYNTGARDWKYNNDYVDSADSWRHSKWLAMMQKRLKIAKRLLNPDNGVLIVTIDEHEVHHLRVLLEELFPGFYIQMITAVINPKGVTQGRFSRVEEYIIYCFAPNAFIADSDDNLLNPPKLNRKPRWKGLLRSGTDALRSDRESMFYPVLIDSKRQMVVKAGSFLPLSENPVLGERIDGYDVAWPVRRDGSWGRWSVGNDTLNDLIAKGYVSCGKYDSQRQTWGISYISQPNQQKIERGSIRIIRRDPVTNVVEIEYAADDTRVIKTVWHRSYHDAGAYGSDMVSSIIGQARAFSFPKSLYSTRDAILAVVRNRKNALIVDFFAGSGTTLHAVNLINAEDQGHRRCILVTNNEVSEADAQELYHKGYQPGDDEWEHMGICHAVTWPRTKYSIEGKRTDGSILSGEYFTTQSNDKTIARNFVQIGFTSADALNTTAKKKQLVSLLGKEKLAQSLVKADSQYIVSEKHTASILFNDTCLDEWLAALEDQEHITDFYIVTSDNTLFSVAKARIEELLGNYIVQDQKKVPMSAGFKANVEYFKLGFLDKSSVELGLSFKSILPMLWLQSGAVGSRPTIGEDSLPEMLIPENSSFAVLLNESAFSTFKNEIAGKCNIEYVYLVTDSQTAFREMASQLNNPNVKQLYRDYIDNFTINTRRNSI